METDRSHRSVFVGNIPYDATEERLKEIFSTVGVVRSFKLVYDRETGKPKGYGFCEYNDTETANSAMSNLNGYEVNGRPIRVDSAVNDRLNDDIKPSIGLSGMDTEQMYASDDSSHSDGIPGNGGGPGKIGNSIQCTAEEMPIMIAQYIQSMSPELKWQTARQFQVACLTNPNEMRRFMLENPPLSLALVNLCTSVGMIDLSTASKLLYKGSQPHPIIQPANDGPPPPTPQVLPFDADFGQGQFHPSQPPPQMPLPPVNHDPRVRAGPPLPIPQEIYHVPPSGMPPQGPPPALDPRLRNQLPPVQPPVPVDPRQARNHYPPGGPPPTQAPGSQIPIQFQPVPPPVSHPASSSMPQDMFGADQSEAEKADLIRQILSLDDAQIAALPEEQRQSILQIKQQLQSNNS